MAMTSASPPASDALFVDLGDDHYQATEFSIGPWSRDALHGGAPSALVAGRLQRAVAAADMGDFVPARLSVELLRPVPLSPLRVTTTIRRPGRKVAVADATLTTEDGTIVVSSTLSCIRREQLDHDKPPSEAPPAPPASGVPLTDERTGPLAFHSYATEHRFVTGRFDERGPATDWIRLMVPVLDGRTPTPLERVAAASDFGNGISGLFSFQEMLYLNPDLTVFLLREPVGEWVGLDAVTRLGPVGVGWAESLLFDADGPIGRAVQTLLLEHRR